MFKKSLKRLQLYCSLYKHTKTLLLVLVQNEHGAAKQAKKQEYRDKAHSGSVLTSLLLLLTGFADIHTKQSHELPSGFGQDFDCHHQHDFHGESVSLLLTHFMTLITTNK